MFGIVLDWRMYRNFCVSATNQDLPTTFSWAGNLNVDACQSECNRNSKCSAIEWYWWGYGLAHCNLILSNVHATKGHPGGRWKDATCYIKPGKRKTELKECINIDININDYCTHLNCL